MSGHELKIRRARQHLEWIDTHLQPWIQGDAHTHWLEPNTDAPSEARVMAKLTKEPRPYPLSVRIGEFLHNMRSALDLLAYELALAYTQPLPDEIAESSEFPIFGDEDRQGNGGVGSANFSLLKRNGDPAPGHGLYKIRGMDPAAQTIVEGLQPYHRSADFREHPLWKLHELDRINKHRLLHVVAAAGVLTLAVDAGADMNDFPYERIESFSGKTLNTEIATNVGILTKRASFSADPVKVHPQASVEVIIDGIPSLAVMDETFNGPPVILTLTEIYNYVWTDVLPALTPYL